MKDKTRLEYLDAAKGLGILLVILGHIYAWNPNINRKILVTWIYSFHMPLFFIVSGMLIKYKNYCNIKEFIFSRIKHILVPYIVFSLCNALVRILLYGYDESAFIRDVICTFILIGVDTWFLQALFLAEIMFIVIRKIVKNEYILTSVIAALFIFSLFITKEDRFLLQYFSRVFVSLGYITIGYKLMYFIQEKKVPNILLVGLCGVQVILARYNTFVDLNNLEFNNKILYVINSVVGATVIILILKNLNVKSRFLRYCGSNSLIIFATHGNLIYLFRKYISTNMHGYISGIGLMILIMLMEVPLIYIIHNYIPWIMGVQKQRK